jgi:acetyl esterase
MGKGVPPMLLIHGTADEQVFYDQSPRFCQELKQAGNECELFTVPDGPHGMSVWKKDPRFHSYKPVLLKWLDARSGKKH